MREAGCDVRRKCGPEMGNGRFESHPEVRQVMREDIEENQIYKVLSILLQYPDRELLAGLQQLRETVQGFSRTTAISVCDRFLAYLESNPLIKLQEEYTRTFDLNAETCLNLSFHRFGDSRERGPALAHLNQLYKAAGWEILTGELPDYLPLMLEFAFVGPGSARNEVLALYREEIGGLFERLKAQESPYAHLIELVLSLSHQSSF